MFKSRSFKRRCRTSSVQAQTPVESLEDRRLLTSTIDGNGETGQLPETLEVQRQSNTAASQRTEHTFEIRLTVDALSGADPLNFEEIHIVGQEVWVLSELQSPPFSEITLPAFFEATDSVTVAIPNVPIKHFRIGGPGGLTEEVEAARVASRDEFHNLFGDSYTELLYSRLAPELEQWRADVETQIIEQADDLYGEQFGAETESPIYYYRGPLTPNINLESTDTFDQTNLQVDGVDEGDIVETDGEYIYTISGNEIVIIKAATADSEAEVVSRIELSQSPVAMFLANDRLTVISQDYGNLPWPIAAIHSAPASARTVVTVLNVADRSAPELAQETIVDGQYQSSRAIGDQVYVVVTNNEGIPYVPELNTVYDTTLESNWRFETRDEYLTRVDELVNGEKSQKGLTPPSVYRRGNDTSDQLSLERLGWLNGAGNASPDGGQLTSVLQFDTTSHDSTPVSNIGVNTRRYGATQIYTSATNLYLVTEEYTYANSNSGNLLIDFAPQPATIESRIHKIGLSTGQLVLEGEGIVPGNVESQFSIDEHDGYLRVATTTGQNWWWTDQASQNHLFVLQDTGDTLDIVGSVRDLAAGERIYSARFDGERAWMVTFRQTDPVFSFDLSDPTNPHVTGELKIPGYSDHLQLIDENHLLAIGRNATEEGRVQEVQVSLFDVSDMAAPTLLHRYSMGSDFWGQSEALQDHLAFNYLPESQILAVPFGTWGQQGIVLLNVDVTDGFEPVGRVNSGPEISLPYTGFSGWNQDNSYKRSVQIDGSLYAVSTAYISVVDLNNPDTVLQTLAQQDNQTPPSPIPELPIENGRLEEILRVTETVDEDGISTELRLELEELLGIELPDPGDIEEYEFRLLDRESGLEILRRSANTPEVSLRNAAGDLPAPDTYDVQFRTRTSRLLNSEFGSWSAPAALAVGSEAAQMISDNSLLFGDRLLQWSRVADRLITAEGSSEFLTNPVSGYDVWINDASTNQRVLLERGVNEPQLPLNLEAGGYFSWFRAVYEDGSTGSWSLRERLEILGQKLTNLIGPGITANTSPSISVPELFGATSFEVEVTAPDGTITNDEVTDLSQHKLQITNSLSPGRYSFRARATLATGVPTEWSDPVEFVVFGQPPIGVNGLRLSLGTAAASAVELWISKAGTQERVFHDTDFQLSTVEDAISELGLDANHLPGYDVWTRFTMADGSRTPWSAKVVLNRQVSDFVTIDPIAAFVVGESQVISWDQGLGIESYEVWISKVGQSGAFRRIADLTTTFIRFEDQLPEGQFNAWVRGKLASGGYTSWGTPRAFTVDNRPVLNIVDQLATWTLAGDTDPNARFEIWINKLGGNSSQAITKMVHETNLNSASFALQNLDSGDYRGWVRKITEVGGTTVTSVWSAPTSFSVPAVSDLTTAFDSAVDVVLSALDNI